MSIRLKGLKSGTLTQTRTSLYKVPVAKAAVLETVIASVLDSSNETKASITFWIKRNDSSVSVPFSPIGYGVEKTTNAFVFESSIALAAGDEVEGRSLGGATVGYDLSGIEEDV
jgi:hypothetical protein